MSQAKVTDFFATRKRNRFNQDEILLNKQKKTHNLIEPGEQQLSNKLNDEISQIKEKLIQASSERCLRSRTKQLSQTTETNQDKPASDEPKKTRGGKKKENLEALKARMNRLDDKISKIVEVEPEQTTKEQEAKKEVVKAKKLNKAELKQKIEQFNKNLQLIQTQQKPQEEEEEQQQEVKNKTDKKELPEEVDIPAYQKFKDLADDHLDPTSTLTLPKSYSLLLDSFKGSDTIVKFLFNRDEICTFLKLRMGIQNITKHNFTLKHLAQIKTVYPQAYIFKQEKLFIDFKNDYHLIIGPNLDEIETNKETNLKQFTPMVLLKRLKKFKTNLFQIVKKLHQEFLESIGITNIPIDNIKRWHQKFDLENLKEIVEDELPKPPTDDSIKCKSGQELLSIAKDIYSSRIQDAIKNTVLTQPQAEPVVAVVSEKKQVELDANFSPDEKILNKLKEKKESSYNALLEKIRNKEKQKQLESLVINNDKEKLVTKYSNYKDAIRFLLFFFQSEKKSTIEFDKVCKKTADNLKASLNELECKELLNEMASDSKEINLFINQEGKKWLNLIKVRNMLYLQMDKTFQLNDLNTIVEQAIEKLKSNS